MREQIGQGLLDLRQLQLAQLGQVGGGELPGGLGQQELENPLDGGERRKSAAPIAPLFRMPGAAPAGCGAVRPTRRACRAINAIPEQPGANAW
ncbi:MAG: hypothetical protein QM777_13230 [Pseudorhodoferax sp.]